MAGDTFTAQLARCVIASRTHYLYFIDKSWVSKYLIPMFNYESSERAADQAWHGYLVWGQLHPELNAHLKPYYIQAVNHLTDTSDRLRESLFKKVADIMLMDPATSPDMEWFYKVLFAKDTTVKDREEILT